MGVKCFLLTDSPFVRRSLRRYANLGLVRCEASGYGYHDARVEIEVVEKERKVGGYELQAPPRIAFAGDPRWPTRCSCGYAFGVDDQWQVIDERLLMRVGSDELVTWRDAEPGAMLDAQWFPWKGFDGRSLKVKCPNGIEWAIDGPANNCTKPDDSEHRCWIRHGEPPVITVDKNGNTCAAGAGSIQAGDYHGFLQNGEFTP